MSATSDDKRSDNHFVSIGGYSPPDADRLLEALSRANIKFEIECDDGIHGSLSKFGTFGAKARIRVWVDPDEISKVTEIRTSLFAE